MSHYDILLDLPIELGCKVVAEFLRLKDVGRLDSAYCHSSKRKVLHKYILQTQQCIISHDIEDESCDPLPWLLSRGIRLDSLRLTSDFACEPYLQKFGKHLQSVSCTKHTAVITAANCANLRGLIYKGKINGSFLKFIQNSAQLEALIITEAEKFDLYQVHTDLTASPHLRIHTLRAECDRSLEAAILNFCAPDCIQRLRINDCALPQWNQFTNLRSLGFHFDPEGITLEEILTACPDIVNLDLYHINQLNDQHVAAAMRAVKRLRTLNIEDSYSIGDQALVEIARYHKHSLEAMYMNDCRIPINEIDQLLAECRLLHTLTIDSLVDIQLALMSNITTLMGNFSPLRRVWRGVRKHCRALQHLYLSLYENNANFTHMIDAVSSLPALCTLHFIGVEDSQLEFVRKALLIKQCKVKVMRGEYVGWYDLFKLPI